MVAPVLDARRRELFAAAYRSAPDGGLEELIGPSALAPAELAGLLVRPRRGGLARRRGGRGGRGGSRGARAPAPPPRRGGQPHPGRRPRAPRRARARDCRRGRCTRACPTPRSTGSQPRARPRTGPGEDGAGQAGRRAAGRQDPRDAPARRPPGRRDRERDLLDALDAGDVHVRARPPRHPRPGRRPRRRRPRLRHGLALRRRLAHPQPRACARRSAAGASAARMLDELFVRAAKKAHLGFTLEVRVSNERGHPPLPAQGLPRARDPPGVLLGQRRGRDHHVARRGPGRSRR